MKRMQKIISILCMTALLLCHLSVVLADTEATPTDLRVPAEPAATTKPEELVVIVELPAAAEIEPAIAGTEQPAEETEQTTVGTEPAADGTEPAEAGAEPAAEQAAEGAEQAPVATEPGTESSEPSAEGNEPVPPEAVAEGEPAAPAAEAAAVKVPETEEELLDEGYVKVTIIRETGTNLYQGMDDRSTVAGLLEKGKVIWAIPRGGFWAEIRKENPKDKPLYFNLNNAVLLAGKMPYELPIRRVTLKSTLEGMTEIEDGTEVTIIAKYNGFQGDEITGVRWQYRPEDDPEGEFRDIEGADGFSYTYQVNAENIHHEWRIVLNLKP